MRHARRPARASRLAAPARAGALALLALAAGVGLVALGGTSNGGSDLAPLRSTAHSRASGALFLGMTAEDVLAGSNRYRKRELGRQRRLGVRLIRQTFDWSLIERRPGRFDFSYYDRYVASLARQRMRILPILFRPPRFRSSRPRRGGRDGTYPPKRASDMARFASRVVSRYGPSGSFWRRHPGVPRTPIRAWQIWNEPSLPVYWPTGPSPIEYARLLRTVGGAIKKIEPAAEIVTAGLPESRLGISLGDFIGGLYDAGASDYFDTLAVHPYALDEDGVVGAVEQARRVIEEHGDSKPIWITEIGWASAGPRSSFTVGRQGQAERVERTIVRLAGERLRLRLRGVVYFNWKDARPFPGGVDFWGLHTGLLDIRGRPKPAAAAFARAARTIRLSRR